MKNGFKKNVGGFALITSMLILLILTILVVNSVRSSTMNEKMAGSYMDRNRAFQTAEQALRQGEQLLFQNAALCSSGCAITETAGVLEAKASSVTSERLSKWDNDALSSVSLKITKAPGDVNPDGEFVITQLPQSVATVDGKTDCRPYSITAKGYGLNRNSGTAVVLQTVTYVCEI